MKAALKEANQFHSIVPKTNSIVLELSGKLKSIIEIRPMNAWTLKNKFVHDKESPAPANLNESLKIKLDNPWALKDVFFIVN
ncbi:hypothetical protein C2G38_2165470 [Gigaspora rosea]|uniref:Uncharacterized protein n=1 Tax=Gigaspora rosea TaxID=44941 RepID=A0A397VV74_9GLOM|nr:hypothetical protein C2G38_2165470 [Gigaspora rosea]